MTRSHDDNIRQDVRNVLHPYTPLDKIAVTGPMVRVLRTNRWTEYPFAAWLIRFCPLSVIWVVLDCDSQWKSSRLIG